MKKFEGILILSDLDGTLLDSDRQISRENREAVRYFVSEGGRFSMATGRSRTGMQYFLKDVDVNAPAVICNGAVVYDFERDTIIRSLPVGQPGYELTLDLMERFPEVGIEVTLLDGEFVAQGSLITRIHFEKVKIPYRPMPPQNIPQPWVKLNLTMEAGKIDALTEYIRTVYPGRFHAQHSAPYFYEILAPGATKGAGALFVCQHLGIKPRDLYVVGDGQNDVELLGCTRNLFAPANAHPDVLRLNPTLLPDCDHSPIAALIRLLDKNR